jgi:hypothetical protein
LKCRFILGLLKVFIFSYIDPTTWVGGMCEQTAVEYLKHNPSNGLEEPRAIMTDHDFPQSALTITELIFYPRSPQYEAGVPTAPLRCLDLLEH